MVMSCASLPILVHNVDIYTIERFDGFKRPKTQRERDKKMNGHGSNEHWRTSRGHQKCVTHQNTHTTKATSNQFYHLLMILFLISIMKNSLDRNWIVLVVFAIFLTSIFPLFTVHAYSSTHYDSQRRLKKTTSTGGTFRTTRYNHDENVEKMIADTPKQDPPPYNRVPMIAASLFLSIITMPWTIITEDSHTFATFIHHRYHDNIKIHPLMTISKSYANAVPLNENQQFASEVWWAVNAQFFDPTFNHMGEDGWKQQKLRAIQALKDTGPEDDDIVTQSIQSMLSSLGDPYTRFLPKEKFETLTTYAKGDSAGIGVSLLNDIHTGKVVIVNLSPNGPAEKAGIIPGDVLLEIDGESMDQSTADVIAARCRGEVGSELHLLIERQSSSKVERRHITLTRSLIKVNPVQVSTFVSKSDDPKKVGLLTIPAFTQETCNQMVDAMRYLQNENVSIVCIDLRGNVGGYMPAGIDLAKLFLAGNRRIVAEVNKAGEVTGYFADGIGAETSIPLFILVDERTASASEIFAAALQDNKRAVLVGSKTFGKGRIQNVQSVGNGSGVSVTRARYITPKGNDVHGVGLTPNIEKMCKPVESAAQCMDGII
jgi:carboxyl-terminal processing protease